MKPIQTLLAEGREAFAARSWVRAHEALGRAGEAGVLVDPDDLWRFALSAFLIGRQDDFAEALQDLHHAHRDRGEARAAARAAIWIGIHHDSRGDQAQATGWFGRAERELEREPGDCAERGYLLIPPARQRLIRGDVEGALGLIAEAVAIAQRFNDCDLLTLALHLEGRVLLRCGRIAEGLARLDEAMIGVTADELSPQVTGLVYCSVLGACREVWALGRVREWTVRLAEWCTAQPDMVAYSGQCRAYRAEVMLGTGEWAEALDEAHRAVERFAGGSQPSATGFAHYLAAEVHRLRGELEEAEEDYRAASVAGYSPQPGLALLRLEQGDGEAAAAAIDRVLAETRDPLRRARLLSAAVEIALALDDLAAAERACEELGQVARSCATDVIGTILAQQRGAVALARGDAAEALAELRPAWLEWQDLDAPWDAARTRVLIALACRELGDEDGAMMEIEAARAEFERLGAEPDVRRTERLTARRSGGDPHGLTPREREVLALVATGRTNRAVARELSISEKTVARHVANIFMKLGLSSRAAATAYAYEHDLLDA